MHVRIAARCLRCKDDGNGLRNLTARDMHTLLDTARTLVRAHRRGLRRAALACALLSLNAAAPAAIFRCVDANGTNTYSDRNCDSKAVADAPPPGSASASSGSETYTNRPDSEREKKAARILEMLHITPVEPETLVLRRTVDDAAPDLVKALDPDNDRWTPANGRWYSVSEFVKADLRRDVQSALRASTAQTARISARRIYRARATDSEMDALSRFLSTPDGTRYVAFQNEIRPLLYEALSQLLAQEPMPPETPSDLVLRQRRQLLSLALEYRIVKDGGRPTAEWKPGSETVAENAARREGTALDALYSEYEAFLLPFQSFTDSATAKHFFAAVEPALRTETALSSTATTDFAEREFDKYAQRWRAIYGPGRARQHPHHRLDSRPRGIDRAHHTNHVERVRIARGDGDSMRAARLQYLPAIASRVAG